MFDVPGSDIADIIVSEDVVTLGKPPEYVHRVSQNSSNRSAKQKNDAEDQQKLYFTDS